MKGFSPRERLGLIILAVVLAGCFILERLVDSSGCERVDARAPHGVIRDSLPAVSDSSGRWIRKSDRSQSRRRSDSVRRANPHHHDEVNDKRYTPGKKAPGTSSRPRKKKDAGTASRRSLRDETL